MADENDPIQQGASAEIKRQEDPSSPVQLELRAPYRIAAELTRIRFEMTAIRKILQGRESIEVEELKRLQGRESIEVEELKRLQGRGNIEGGTF